MTHTIRQLFKKYKIKNTSSMPSKTKTKNNFNKNNFETKILNEYFSVSTNVSKHMEIGRIKAYYFKNFV